MAAQKGRDVLIKIEDAPGAGTFTAVGGLRAKTFRLGNPETDLSDSESPGAWTERGVGFGLKSVEIAGQGIWKATAQLKQIVNSVLQSEVLRYQMVVPALGTFEGPFTCGGGIDLGAAHDGEVSFSTSFNSAGEIAFTASA